MLAVQLGGGCTEFHLMATGGGQTWEKKKKQNAGGAPERMAPQREVSLELRLEVKTVREWR